MDDADFSNVTIDQLNIGIEKYLEKKSGICKVHSEDRTPADRHAVLTWEQKNCCLLPEDLKNFYLTSNGFDLTWSVKMDNQCIPVGKMHINPVEELARIDVGNEKQTHIQPSLADLETESDTEDTVSGIEKPSFTGRNRIYELDSCEGYSKVCLIYKEAKLGIAEPTVEIWFLDRALRWHYMASSFLEYYRLMLMHLGLPQWQYAFTDIGLSCQAKQWFNMYAPIRLEVDGEITELEPGKIGPAIFPTSNPLDLSKVFKARTDRKKPNLAPTQNQGQTQAGKKKPPVSSARSQGSLSSKTSQGFASQGPGKGLK